MTHEQHAHSPRPGYKMSSGDPNAYLPPGIEGWNAHNNPGPDIRNFMELGTSSGAELSLHIARDGRNTLVEIGLDGEPVGRGVSRRHKRDKRDSQLGITLAMARAFADAAERYERTVEHLVAGSGEPLDAPDGYEQWLKEQRAARANQRAVEKDIKRADARRRYVKEHGDVYGGPNWRP